MARAGMANLILELRGMTGVGTATQTVNGVAWFTDDQLEDIMDRHRETCYDVPLASLSKNIGGTEVYYDYQLPHNRHWYEEDAVGSNWQVKDSTGGTSVPTHSVNYQHGMVTFTADQGGTAYMADFDVYDLNMAAADVWEQRAMNVAAVTDWSSDNHSVSAGRQIDNFKSMAATYRAKSGPISRTFVRSDER